MKKSRFDAFFSIPAVAILMAILCNMLWALLMKNNPVSRRKKQTYEQHF